MNSDEYARDVNAAGIIAGAARGYQVYQQTGDANLAMRAGVMVWGLVLTITICLPGTILGLILLCNPGVDIEGNLDTGVQTVGFWITAICASLGALFVWGFVKTQKEIKAKQSTQYRLPRP